MKAEPSKAYRKPRSFYCHFTNFVY